MKNNLLIFLQRYKFIALLSIVTVFAFLVRFYKFGLIPSASTPDETIYIYNAYSLWLTHYDVAGRFMPLSSIFLSSFAPVPLYLIAPFVGIFGVSLFFGRLPFLITGILEIIIVSFMTKKITNNDLITIFVAFILAVSPWAIQFSRIAYDGSLALLFFSLGILMFLYLKDKGNILWTLIPFFLGFNSYHGTKLFFLFLIPFLLIVFWKDISKRKKELNVFILGIMLIFASFLFILKTQGVNRQSILLGNNSSTIAFNVNIERDKNIAPTILREIFSNKPLVYLKTIQTNYLGAFSTNFLFVSGEQGDNQYLYGVGNHGVMYIIELPFLLLGILYFLSLKNKYSFFVIGGLLISPLPSAFTIDQSYGMRSIMMLPFLAILTAAGVYFAFQQIKSKNNLIKYGLVSVVVIIYAFLITSYLYQYFFRYPIYAAESWHQSSRDVVEYIYQKKDKFANIYIADSGGLLFNYGLYNKIDPTLIQKAYQSSLPRKVGNISFIGDCINIGKAKFNINKFLPQDSLYIVPPSCYKNEITTPVFLIKNVGEPLEVRWKFYQN